MRFLRRLGIAVLAAPVIVIGALFWAIVASHLATFFGFGNGQGNSSHYLFWSGAGSDLAYLSFLGAGIAVYRKHNCPVKWCLRIGKHEFTDPKDGVKRLLCWKHHPDVKHKVLNLEHVKEIQARRHLYFGSKPGRG